MNILVFSAHADDETLGAGGYLLKAAQERHTIGWFNFTNKTVEYGYDIDEVSMRNLEINMVRESYEFDFFFDFGLQPAKLDIYPRAFLVEKVSEQIEHFRPNIVLVPFAYDAHSDHQIASDVVISCTKSFRVSSINEILIMEIISETDYGKRCFCPNYFVDITGFIDKKIEIMKIYKSEIKSAPFPRSEDKIRALASFRGAAINSFYAEAFKVFKIIQR